MTSIDDAPLPDRQRLTRLAQRYDALVSATGSVVWVIDPELRPTGRSEGWEEYTGLSFEEYGRRGWMNAIHPDDIEPLRRAMAEAQVSGDPLSLELRVRRADGEFRCNLVRAVPVRDGHAIVEWIGTATDIEDARRAASDLAAFEERLRLAHAAAGIGTWEWNLTRGDVRWSPVIFQMAGVDPSARPTSELWSARIHPDDRPVIEQRWAASLASTATHFANSFRLVRPDGSIRWIISSGALFRDSSGSAVRALGLNTDITTQRILQEQMEAALAEQRDLRARLLALTEGAEALLGSRDEASVRAGVIDLATRVLPADAYAIWWLDKDRREWSVVHSVGLSAGYAAARLTGDEVPFGQPMSLDDTPSGSALEGRRSAYAEEGIASLLTIPLPIRGERRATLVAYYRAPHRSSETEIRVGMALGQLAAAALGNAEANAVQARAHAAAERQAIRMGYLADASARLGSFDYETTLREIARLAVPRIADWCAIDLVQPGGQLARVVTEHADPQKIDLTRALGERYTQDPNAPAGVPAVLRTGQLEFHPHVTDDMIVAAAVDASHLEMLRAVGLHSTLVAPLSARGRTLGTITFVSSSAERVLSADDVTVLAEVARRAALAIDNARLYQEAELANRAKEEFLALLSHELRTPLNAIMGWSHMLRQGLPDETRAHAVEVIRRNAHAQKQLVEDLLDVARIASGRLELQLASIDLRDIGRSSVDSALPSAQGKGIALEFDAASEPVTVRGDADRLQQVAANLLANAVKFTEADGTIRVTIQQAGGEALWSVTDTGAGIVPDFLPHVFDRFSQGESSLSRSYAGLGLGLWVVKQIVDAHGGRVRAESEGRGRGATITISLAAC